MVPMTTQDAGDEPLSAVWVAVTSAVILLVGITSSIALVFSAAQRAGASLALAGSWLAVVCLGMGIGTIWLSWRYRVPFVLAWSTPGAALLATMPADTGLAAVTGAFLLAGVLYLVVGATGLFDRLVDRIPLPLASALLAGVLARFALEAFASAGDSTVLVVVMFLAHIVTRRFAPQFGALLVLLAGAVVTAVEGTADFSGIEFSFAAPTWTTPSFDLGTLVGVGIPLFLVTMAAQNVPGVAALRAHGYQVSAAPAVVVSGVATAVGAPFGLFSINLAAITASMAMDPQIHSDRMKRWPVAIGIGVGYCIVGAFGGSLASVLDVLPRPLIIATAAFALLPTITNALSVATSDVAMRDAGVATFLVTVSGVTIADIGSAFWAIVAGSLMLLIARCRHPVV